MSHPFAVAYAAKRQAKKRTSSPSGPRTEAAQGPASLTEAILSRRAAQAPAPEPDPLEGLLPADDLDFSDDVSLLEPEAEDPKADRRELLDQLLSSRRGPLAQR